MPLKLAKMENFCQVIKNEKREGILGGIKRLDF